MSEGENERPGSVLWFGASLAVGLVTLWWALEFGGSAASARIEGIPDAGSVTQRGLPILRFMMHATATGVVGLLVAAVFLLPSSARDLQGLASRAVGLASRFSFGWAAISAGVLWFTIADLFAVTPMGAFNQAFVWSVVAGTGLGRALALQVLIGVAVGFGCRLTASVRMGAVLLGVVVASLFPVAASGHAAGSGSHSLAGLAVYVHIVAMVVWAGGLGALLWIAWRGSKRLGAAVRRFSVLAGWCVATLAITGLINAWARLASPSDLLTTNYGILIVVKVVLLAALVYLGARQRSSLDLGPGVLWRLGRLEFVVIGAALAISVALSRSPTPTPSDVLTSRIEQLLGGSLPPAPTWDRLLWGWNPNGFGLLIVGLGMVLYFRGVWVLHQRGESWPSARILSWVAGMILIGWATFGGLGQYYQVLFSAHIASQLMLSMIVPIFLVMAAPLTLALRTTPGPRQPGDVSPRTMLETVVNSRLVRLIERPTVVVFLVVGTFYGLYFTSALGLLINSNWGHALMGAHFLAIGLLFHRMLIAPRPGHSSAPWARVCALLSTVVSISIFALITMSTESIFANEYWTMVDRPYLSDLRADQYVGGAIFWVLGVAPMLVVGMRIFLPWRRPSQNEKRHFGDSERMN